MVNITNSVTQSVTLNCTWSIQLFHICINNLTEQGYIIDFWHQEQNWATILTNDKSVIIGYIWYKYPLVFLKNTGSDVLQNYIKKEYVYLSLIIVERLDEQNLICSTNIFEQQGIDTSWLSQPFSVDDFCFWTMT